MLIFAGILNTVVTAKQIILTDLSKLLCGSCGIYKLIFLFYSTVSLIYLSCINKILKKPLCDYSIKHYK